MAWNLSGAVPVADPASGGWVRLGVPLPGSAIAWGVGYGNANQIQRNWARVGWVVPGVLVQGEFLVGPEVVIPGVSDDSRRLLAVPDFSFMEQYPGVDPQANARFVFVQLVPYAPPASILLFRLT